MPVTVMVGSCVPDRIGPGAGGVMVDGGGPAGGGGDCAKAPAQTDVNRIDVDASKRARKVMKTPI